MRRTPLVCCILCLFALLGSAHGSMVTVLFSGSVTQVPLDEVYGDIAFGDAITGSYTFDTSAVDLIPGTPSIGSYSFSAPFGMTATIGAHVFDASGSLNIGILNSFVDQYTVLAQSAAGDLTLELFLQDLTGGSFISDQLPPTAPPLAGFPQRDFHLRAMFTSGEVQIDGEIDPLPVQAVPEPGTAGLLATVVTILVFLARGRRVFQSTDSGGANQC